MNGAERDRAASPDDDLRAPAFSLALLARAMRPRQWAKNVLLFAGLYFAGRLTDPASIGRAILGFAVFCAVSGAVYLLNDVVDVERDRLHPKKRFRPIASGELSVRAALVACVVAVVVGLGVAWALSPWFGLVTLAYAAMMFAYSLALKEVFIVDTIVIALGFIIRAVAGVIVLRTAETEVPLTPWFVVCVMFLSLLIAFCKRRSERVNMSDSAHRTRPVLELYSLDLLDRAISACASGALMSYTLYATNSEKPWLMLTTLVFVIYGIFRYLHLVYSAGEGEAPEMLITGDLPLIVCVALWALTLIVVYLPLQ